MLLMDSRVDHEFGTSSVPAGIHGINGTLTLYQVSDAALEGIRVAMPYF